jgi:pectin methylesterase-like acyl-CoA thioesterase
MLKKGLSALLVLLITAGVAIAVQRGGPSHTTSERSNVINVSKDGGEFLTIQNAIDSITDASATNWYTIDVAPGLYVENLTLKNYVSLVGKGGGRDVIVYSTSGTVLTLPSEFSYVERMAFQSAPTASGAKVIDAPNGGSHTIFFAGALQSSSTNGITGNLISASSSSSITFVESAAIYTMSGTSAGTNTHNVISLQNTSSLRYFRSDAVASVADVDDDINLISDSSTGDFTVSSTEWNLTTSHASYSGTANIFKHTGEPQEMDQEQLMRSM